MYGYFLKRIDQRFQLEKAMKILPGGSDEGETGIEQAGREGGEGSMKKRKRRIKLFPQTKKLVRLWEGSMRGVVPAAK